MTTDAGSAAQPELSPKWPGIDNHYLVFEADEFIVFLDKALAVDWATSPAYDEAGFQDSKKFYEVIGRAAEIECVPNEHHSREVRVAFKRMIGEGIARALDHEYDTADKVLDKARSYIADRNVESARYWQLSTACGLGVAVSLLGIIAWAMRSHLIPVFSELVFFVMFSAGAGALGAVLSMIFRMGRNFPSSEAPIRLHVLESCGHVLAGSLCGLFISGTVIMGLILSKFGDPEHLHATILVSAMASGASERWAPSLITQLSGNTGEKQHTKGGPR